MFGLAYTAIFSIRRHRIATTRNRLAHLIVMDLLAAGLILLISALTAGVQSPVNILLILPVIFLAIAYSRGASLSRGAAIIAGEAILIVAMPDGSASRAAMF